MIKSTTITLFAIFSTQYTYAETVTLNGMSCYTVAPEMPKNALHDGVTGEVVATVKMINGVPQSVTMVSGSVIFYNAVEKALMQYKCSNQKGESSFSQSFNFAVQESDAVNKNEIPQRQREAPSQSKPSFADNIKGAAGNRDERIAINEVQRLLNDLRMNMINSQGNPDALKCKSLEGTDILFHAAENLTNIRLPNTEKPGARAQFQSDYSSFQRICPLEIGRANSFLDGISKILTDARTERMKLEDIDRDSKEAQQREEWNLKAQKSRQLAQARADQENEMATRREEDAKARRREQAVRRESDERNRLTAEAQQSERIAAFRSGKISIELIASQIQSNAIDPGMVSVYPGFEIVPGVYAYYWTDRFREKGNCQFEFRGKGPTAANGVRKWRLVYAKSRSGEVLATESFFGSDSTVRMYFDNDGAYTEFNGNTPLQLSAKVADRLQSAHEVKLVHGFSGANEISFTYDMSAFATLRKVALKLCQ